LEAGGGEFENGKDLSNGRITTWDERLQKPVLKAG
jgi:hypothetical protein